jgi:hypothetical protein
MFGRAFSFAEGASESADFGYMFAVVMVTANVRIHCMNTVAILTSFLNADMVLMYSAVRTCLFIHSHGIASTAWPSTGYVRSPPDACQPRGRVVACDVVGPQGGQNPLLSCWYYA